MESGYGIVPYLAGIFTALRQGEERKEVGHTLPSVACSIANTYCPYRQARVIDESVLDLILGWKSGSQVSAKYSPILGQVEKSASEDMMLGPSPWIDLRDMRNQNMI